MLQNNAVAVCGTLLQLVCKFVLVVAARHIKSLSVDAHVVFKFSLVF
jgi:hypothetical protein